MFTEERREAVIRKLNLEGKVRVRELSEEFQVTEDCIRKDLKALENAGRLKRKMRRFSWTFLPPTSALRSVW